jgi:hypothetical protein
MRGLLIRCYPAAWRERYGDEFEAILEERPLGPFDVADIILGALDARLRMRDRRAGVTQGKGFSMSLRIGGIAAILGAATLATGWVVGSGLVSGTETAGPLAGILLLVGMGSLLVAIAGLTAFQARTYPIMSWAACGLLIVGTVIAAVGFLGALLGRDGFWDAGAVGVVTALVGSTLFAIVTYRTAALSRAAAVLLGVGSVVPFLSIPTNQPIFIVGALVCFLVGWLLLGLQAIRLDGPATDPHPA